MKMKCLSLWQPWAQAIALGRKQIETRSWSTPYRGLVAIHASKRATKDIVEWYNNRMNFHFEDKQAFLNAGFTSFSTLPLGHVVAVAELHACIPTTTLVLERRVTTLEMAWGNYDRNRVGWMLTNIKRLAKPVKLTGRQGLFNVEIEDSAL